MKKYLLPPNVNWYRANFHCHTTESDGHFTPEQVKEAYKAQGYSIVAYTDHEKLLPHQDLNDESFLALTSSELSLMVDNDPIPVLENEPTDRNWTHRRTYHMNIFSKNPNASGLDFLKNTIYGAQRGFFPGSEQECKELAEFSYEKVNEVIAKCNEAGFFVQLNHPFWSMNIREDYMALKGLWGLEILNYATQLITLSEYCPFVYDDMLRSGENKSLRCTMGDDNHNRRENDRYRGSFGGSTIIGAKELTYEAIIDALEKGHFYCSSGAKTHPEIHALYIEDGVVKVDCSPASDVFFIGYTRRFQNAYGENLTHAEFPLTDSDTYFHIIVRDKFDNRAHSQTYNVKDFL
jgi:hypothetical protein